MSIHFNSAELVSHQAVDESKTAAVTDSHYGHLRHEAQTKVNGEVQVAYERNMRETAYMEIGLGRNMVRVV